MKKFAILILLVVVFTTGFAQNHLKTDFEKDLIAYTNAFNNKQWDTVTEMMYPRILK